MNLIGYGFLSFFSKSLKKIAIVIFIFGLFMSAGVVVLDRYICTKTNCISQSFEQLGRQGEYWINEYLRVYADIDKYKYQSYKKRFKYHDFTDENKFYQLNNQFKYKAEIIRSTRVDHIVLLFFSFRKSDYTYSKLSLPDFEGESKKWLADSTLQVSIGKDSLFNNPSTMKDYERFLPDWFESRQHYATINAGSVGGVIEIYHEPGSLFVYTIHKQ